MGTGGGVCAGHAEMCTDIGMITESVRGLTGTIERLLAQSNEHYDTETALRRDNAEQNTALALINANLKTLLDKQVKEEKKQEIKDQAELDALIQQREKAEAGEEEKLKEKRRRTFILIMAFVSPFASILVAYVVLKLSGEG